MDQPTPPPAASSNSNGTPPPAGDDGPLTLDSIFKEAANEELVPPAKAPDGTEGEPASEDTPSGEDGAPDDNKDVLDDTHEGEDKPPVANGEGGNKPRDYSRFDKEDHPFLKQMSRPAFEHFSKKLIATQAAIAERDGKLTEMQKVVDEASGKKLPDAWYNDPEAGKLSPAYKENLKGFNDWQAKTHELTELLDGVEAGELVYDGKAFVARKEDDETAVDRRMIRLLQDKRQECYEKQREFADKANAIEQQFGNLYKSSEQHVTAYTDKFFPWTKDEKHVHQENFKAINNEWPEPYRKHPVAKFASALAVQHLVLQKKLADVQKELAAAKNVSHARRSAGPIPGRGGARPAQAEDDKPLKLADFE